MGHPAVYTEAKEVYTEEAPEMTVKLRKVVHSYVVTIPKEFVLKYNLEDGQEMTVSIENASLMYSPVQNAGIEWEKYETASSMVPDNMTPDEFIRSMRDDDDEDLL